MENIYLLNNINLFFLNYEILNIPCFSPFTFTLFGIEKSVMMFDKLINIRRRLVTKHDNYIKIHGGQKNPSVAADQFRATKFSYY